MKFINKNFSVKEVLSFSINDKMINFAEVNSDIKSVVDKFPYKNDYVSSYPEHKQRYSKWLQSNHPNSFQRVSSDIKSLKVADKALMSDVNIITKLAEKADKPSTKDKIKKILTSKGAKIFYGVAGAAAAGALGVYLGKKYSPETYETVKKGVKTGADALTRGAKSGGKKILEGTKKGLDAIQKGSKAIATPVGGAVTGAVAGIRNKYQGWKNGTGMSDEELANARQKVSEAQARRRRLDEADAQNIRMEEEALQEANDEDSYLEQADREANGGLSDQELEEFKRKEREARAGTLARAAKRNADNKIAAGKQAEYDRNGGISDKDVEALKTSERAARAGTLARAAKRNADNKIAAEGLKEYQGMERIKAARKARKEAEAAKNKPKPAPDSTPKSNEHEEVKKELARLKSQLKAKQDEIHILEDSTMPPGVPNLEHIKDVVTKAPKAAYRDLIQKPLEERKSRKESEKLAKDKEELDRLREEIERTNETLRLMKSNR